MSVEVLKLAVNQAEDFRARFVREQCRSAEDAMALAVAMAQQAEIIFTQLGGAKMASAQFYAFADRLGAADAASNSQK